MPEGRRTAWTEFFCWLLCFTKSLSYWRIHIRKFHPGSLQEVCDAGLAGSQGIETQRFGLTSLIHTFPFYGICSAFQPRLGTEDRWGSEVGMKAKLAREWAFFVLHAQPRLCITAAAASVTAGCCFSVFHPVKHRVWGGTEVCTTKHTTACQGCSGFCWEARLLSPIRVCQPQN